MTRAFSAGAAVVFLLGVLAVRAVDPWTERPYTQWTEEEVRQVLEDSPWAQRVYLTDRTRRSTGSSRMEGARDVQAATDRAQPSVVMPVNIGEMRHAFTVVWASARTAREAVVRRRQLDGAATPEEEKGLSRPSRRFQLRVQGPALSTCCPEPHSCYLKPRRSQQAILPVQVEFVEEPGGSRSEVRFYFLRSLGGKPVIGPNEKKVEFHCQSDTGPFKAVFDLDKMARDNQPDL